MAHFREDTVLRSYAQLKRRQKAVWVLSALLMLCGALNFAIAWLNWDSPGREHDLRLQSGVLFFDVGALLFMGGGLSAILGTIWGELAELTAAASKKDTDPAP